jgi:hypothetical protein
MHYRLNEPKQGFFLLSMLMRLSLLAAALGLTASAAIADQGYRPCEREDMIGVWEIVMVKPLINLPKNSYFDNWLMPYQVVSFTEDGSYRRMGFSKTNPFPDASQDKIISVLAQVPPERFNFEGDGIVATVDQDGKVLNRYGCTYHSADFPAVNIAKGTVTFKHFVNGQPAFLHNYRKLK